jgi:DNA-binding MarR family transcriptional regulator
MSLIIAMNTARNPTLRAEDVAQVRRFDRLCERRIADLQERALINETSWAQMLVLEELSAVPDGRSVAWLRGRIPLDRGYMCRVLKDLQARGVVRCHRSGSDRRLREYELTQAGNRLAKWINTFHEREILFMLDLMPRRDARRLVQAMRTVETQLRRHTLPRFCEPWRSALRKRALYRPRGGPDKLAACSAPSTASPSSPSSTPSPPRSARASSRTWERA